MSSSYPIPFAQLKMPLFSFKGRIPRSVWWAATGLNWVAMALVLSLLFNNIPEVTSKGRTVVGALVIPFFVWGIWTNLALGAKRWHDMDRSAWLSLLIVVPYIGIIAIIYYGFVRGTAGPNRYGDDPLASDAQPSAPPDAPKSGAPVS